MNSAIINKNTLGNGVAATYATCILVISTKPGTKDLKMCLRFSLNIQRASEGMYMYIFFRFLK